MKDYSLQKLAEVKRYRVNNLWISRLSLKQALGSLIDSCNNHNPAYACFTNTHMTVEASYDQGFAEMVNNANLVLPDGYPIAKSLKFLYGVDQERIPGMDFLPSLLKECDRNKLSVFFLGSTPEVIQNSIERIKKEYSEVEVKGQIIPPFGKEWDNESYIEQINTANPHFVFVSLGCPKQEKWMATYSSRINSILLGIGAAVPVFAGLQSRSPKWMSENGLEWLYRLLQEPRRLFMRYFTSNFVFIYLFIKEFFKIRIFGIRKNTVISDGQQSFLK